MLQTYILAIISIFSASLLSSQNNSLVIFSASGNPFILSVDGTKINQTPQSNIKTFELSAGRHILEITVPSKTVTLQFKDSVEFVNEPKYNNKEFTYALIQTNQKLRLEFKSVSELSGPAVPPIPEAPKETAPVVDNSIYGNLYQAKNNKPVFFNHYDTERNSCQTVLNDKDISYALKLLKTINDEERQLNYAKTIIANNCYTTAQLEQLLLTFPSEMDRLEIAKPAYRHVSDKKNITQLYPVFKYQTIKDNYSAYIQEQENTELQKKLNCSQPVDATRFEQIYTTIKNSGYENEKLAAAKKSFVNTCLSTEQAQKLAALFTHDREKLECMKCIYPVITDKDKAALLEGQFQFSETKTEFLKFISK